MESFLIRTFLASVFGAAIGFQRELKDRPAGLRTHTLVALASCIFTIASLEAFEGGDPSRIASNVAVGIGFIGAGTIIKQGNIIIGLTTAASLWTVAAIGVLVGAGFHLMAAAATLMALVVLVLLKEVEERVGRKKQLDFEIKMQSDRTEQLQEAFGRTGFIFEYLETRKEDGYLSVRGCFRFRSQLEKEKLIKILGDFGEIIYLKWQ